MGSYNFGKTEAIEWIKSHFKQGDTCLDVGACDGKWAKLLDGYLDIEACEIFLMNIRKNELETLYKKVYCCDIKNLEYKYYDLIIFGDVIEHMTVEDAQKSIKYAWDRCKDMIVVVPYLYYQDEMYGNKYEKHLQPELTPKLFDKRYPGFEVFWENGEYAYYHKK